jgi:uncharacterized protein
MTQEFEWDEKKDKANQRKHQISFEEARTVFDDPFLATFPDVMHSVDEDRNISLGTSDKDRVLVVVHTDRGNNIRLISCRLATVSERKAYAEGNF